MIVYLAHPVGQGEDRPMNIENVQKWFLYFIKHAPDWTINVPWFIYVSNLDESHRTRAIRDDLTILNTCDAIVLCGGKITGGMQMELGLAQSKDMSVLDLTKYGYEVDETNEGLKAAVETF